MIHERFDLASWIKQFPLAKMRVEDDIGFTMTGPLPIVYVEQIRSEVRGGGGVLGAPMPVDLCVWNHGDSPSREVTKIGGIPYWPTDEPWPKAGWRKPYTFLAQICFADSHDILPKLPGDLLSILQGGDRGDQVFEFRWFKLGKQQLPVAKLPRPRWQLLPSYATLHRTADYPTADYRLFEKYPRPLEWWAMVLRDATKIGGSWSMRSELPDVSEDDDPELIASVKAARKVAAKRERSFLCQLGNHAFSVRYPYLNLRSADQLSATAHRELLRIGDVGGYDYFFDAKQLDYECWSG